MDIIICRHIETQLVVAMDAVARASKLLEQHGDLKFYDANKAWHLLYNLNDQIGKEHATIRKSHQNQRRKNSRQHQ